MRRFLMILALMLTAASAWSANDTATLVSLRAKKGTAVTPGQWHAGLAETKAYAEKMGLPLVAVWSNGELCGHCQLFESAVNSEYFRKWMKASGLVFHFSYSGDPAPDGPEGGSTYYWCWQSGTLRSYPFVRLYWPKGKVDKAYTGDSLDGGYGAETGGKKVAVALAKVFADYFDKKKAAATAAKYAIAFNANGGTGMMPAVAAVYGTAQALPANAFVRTDHAFAGWALTPDGAVKFKNGAAVKNLTSVAGSIVTLYAVWTKVIYRTYYVGVKTSIVLPGFSGCAAATKVPGLTWSSSKGAFAGTPTKAGTYKVIFTKGSASTWRIIVIEQDEIIFADETAVTRVIAEGEAVSLSLSPVSHAGTPLATAASGLPPGLSYVNGAIVGQTSQVGTFSVTVGMVSAAKQKLYRTFNLTVGVPESLAGVYNGFVGLSAGSENDELALTNRGFFRFVASSAGALAAKVVTAKGATALTGNGWASLGNGTYLAELKSSSGKDAFAVEISTAESQVEFREIGVFAPSYGTRYSVWAQRSPFERDAAGNYVDAAAGAVMGKIAGLWYFRAYKVGSEWMLGYGTKSTYDVAVKVAADGTTKVAGKIGSLSFSAASSVFMFAGDVESGFVRADFPVPVVVSGKKVTLDIWANLWFDRSNAHFNARGEGIGGMSLEAFK